MLLKDSLKRNTNINQNKNNKKMEENMKNEYM